jgi:membrane protease YdiL (CAAX protease family)
MSKLKSLVLPFGVTAFYIIFAIILSLFTSNSLIVTVIDNITVAILGLVLIRKFNKMDGRASVKSITQFVILLVGALCIIWFTCQITSTVIYNVLGDSSFDTYQDIANSDIMLYAVISVFIAPLTEEVMTRGLWFGFLKQKWCPLAGYIASPIVFAILHGTLVHIPTGILFGLFLCLIYDYTGKLFIPVLLHFGFNLFAIVFSGLVVPGAMLTVPFALILYILVFAALVAGIMHIHLHRDSSDL